MDYSKWDAVAAASDAEDARLQSEQRDANKAAYVKEQQQRIAEYESNQLHSHAQSDSHHDQRQHPHTHAFHRATRTCGCGFTDVATLKRLQAESEQQPKISIEEKNAKKIDAIAAVRQHGRELSQSGDWAAAYAVYERGALIIAGMLELDDAQQSAMDEEELILTLNMALCRLQLREHAHCIELCRQALQFDTSSDCAPSGHRVKAYVRMAQSLVELGEYDKARQSLAIVLRADSTHDGAVKCQRLIVKREVEQRVKAKEFQAKLRAKLQQQSLSLSHDSETKDSS